MQPTQFQQLAEETLQKLHDNIEEKDTDYRFETDLLDGILNIELEDGSEYVINKHDASMQIWMSSPISGASHFSYQEGRWVDSKGNDFLQMIEKELGI
jgi:frataxin